MKISELPHKTMKTITNREWILERIRLGITSISSATSEIIESLVTGKKYILNDENDSKEKFDFSKDKSEISCYHDEGSDEILSSNTELK